MNRGASTPKRDSWEVLSHLIVLVAHVGLAFQSQLAEGVVAPAPEGAIIESGTTMSHSCGHFNRTASLAQVDNRKVVSHLIVTIPHHICGAESQLAIIIMAPAFDGALGAPHAGLVKATRYLLYLFRSSPSRKDQCQQLHGHDFSQQNYAKGNPPCQSGVLYFVFVKPCRN